MKKAIGQTVRDLKREVNKTVLKVPKIEQKVLDATSNEPWGPHGSQLAEIAYATKNYNDYQIIIAVLWKRINDTGKNWRHVYKALAVLEYLVVHGSERVTVEIREHAHQISTLSNFQYIDSGGRDQGNNVRRKAQNLVILVNDKEKVRDIRRKADANVDRSSSHSSSGGNGERDNNDRYESRYGNRDDDRNGYGRDREWGQTDDNYHGRRRGSNGHGEDHYVRDSDDSYSKDGYRDDDHKASGSKGDNHHASRDRRSDRGGEYHPYEDDDQCSSRQLERKRSEQNSGAPPSYEEAVSDARSHPQEKSERDGGPVAATPSPKALSPSEKTSEGQTTTTGDVAASPPNKEANAFNGFDPLASTSVAPCTASAADLDLLAAFSDSFASNSFALMPAVSTAADPANYDFGSTPVPSSAPAILNQTSENPFGDSPFEATPFQGTFISQTQNFAPTTSLQPLRSVSLQPLQSSTAYWETVPAYNFGDALSGISSGPPGVSNIQPPTPPTNSPFGVVPSEDNSAAQPTNIQHPPTTPKHSSFSAVPSHNNFSAKPTNIQHPPRTPTDSPFCAVHSEDNFTAQTTNSQHPATPLMHSSFRAVPSEDKLAAQPHNFGSGTSLQPPATSVGSETLQSTTANVETGPAFDFGDMFQCITSTPSVNNVQLPSTNQELLHSAHPSAQQSKSDGLGNILPQSGPTGPIVSQAPLTVSTSRNVKDEPSKNKFEPKSAVWADTLSRGLVDLNISGPKTNPLADIGVDFDSINRKEKRKEKTPAAPVTSTITMGKAMGAGSGIGRAGATTLMPSLNPMFGSGMGMGMGMGMGGGAGMGMGGGIGMGMGMGNVSGMVVGGYRGGMNQTMGMNMGVGMGMHLGMNNGMGQGTQMLPAPGLLPGPGMQGGGYNPMMGMGGYPSHQPYGGHR
ncbi:Epsin domain-containing protein [Cinnamomum micranthum f. kanehirae]|uniref:Epsin domain-containing protein n=1 Tax=Cinnamomum micranthum f. kanehirae TaxID=337451 RepID=A0A443NZK2_9MAGN|nr:Epsin domain-containing protein [Cinnamomum micranthum f. kanehirae]